MAKVRFVIPGVLALLLCPISLRAATPPEKYHAYTLSQGNEYIILIDDGGLSRRGPTVAELRQLIEERPALLPAIKAAFESDDPLKALAQYPDKEEMRVISSDIKSLDIVGRALQKDVLKLKGDYESAADEATRRAREEVDRQARSAAAEAKERAIPVLPASSLLGRIKEQASSNAAFLAAAEGLAKTGNSCCTPSSNCASLAKQKGYATYRLVFGPGDKDWFVPLAAKDLPMGDIQVTFLGGAPPEPRTRTIQKRSNEYVFVGKDGREYPIQGVQNREDGEPFALRPFGSRGSQDPYCYLHEQVKSFVELLPATTGVKGAAGAPSARQP